MNKIELAKILYALQQLYGKEEAVKLFERLVETIIS